MAQVAPEPPADDGSIPNEARLLRRVSLTIGVDWNDDGSAGRVSSGAFKPRKTDEGLSVYVEAKVEDLGFGAIDVLAGLEGRFYLVAIPASVVREHRNGIVMDPDDSDPRLGLAHALITGKLSDKARTAMAASCDYIVWE